MSQEKICTQCKAQFIVEDDDLEFYDKISPVFDSKKFPIPAPTLCPDCRYQARIAWRNERNLYSRKCDKTSENIISIFSPDKTWPPVYSQEAWWGDTWSPFDYGRDFDFSKSFFEQFYQLFKCVPQLALNNQKSENSKYTNQSQSNKNCYMCFSSSFNENCMYGMWYQKCKDSYDCQYTEMCELCYEVLNAKNCYNCKYSQDLENCTNCSFCANCTGCKDCFGSVNLNNKQYYFFNEKLTQEEYTNKINSLVLSSLEETEKLKKEFIEHKLKYSRKFYQGNLNENSSGDYLEHNKNTRDCFNARDNENLKFSQDAWKAKNCQDMTETLDNNFCYQAEGAGWGTCQIFASKIVESSNIYYSSHIYYSHDIFGCVGLRNASYCVFNKQYSKEEYEKLVAQIIEHMMVTPLHQDSAGSVEWGEWFSIEYSPFGYNETVAMDYFPLDEAEAKKLGGNWQEKSFDIEFNGKYYKPHDNIDSYKNNEKATCELLDGILKCEVSGKPFKITPQELAFYVNNNIPIPKKSFYTRFLERFNLRNPRKLYHRKCMNNGCTNEFETTYAPDRPEKVFCESCYQKSII